MAKEEINAFLGAGTVYQGTLHFQDAVRIDGRFTGEISSDGMLIVGKDAEVDGEVTVGEFVLAGNFRGAVVAKYRVVLHKTAIFVGTVHSPNLVMEEGASLDGQLVMRHPVAAEDASTTAE